MLQSIGVQHRKIKFQVLLRSQARSVLYEGLADNIWVKYLPGTWHLAPGTWHLAPGTWHLAPGTWHLAAVYQDLTFSRSAIMCIHYFRTATKGIVSKVVVF